MSAAAPRALRRACTRARCRAPPTRGFESSGGGLRSGRPVSGPWEESPTHIDISSSPQLFLVASSPLRTYHAPSHLAPAICHCAAGKLGKATLHEE